ncbi:MAG: arsenate reductase ArsC [Anaerolineae bacterium]|nr:arsenate reductase ArsC [Anaerolineae bacterium]
MKKPQKKKQRVLILCTGNSCRSQMAEGLVNHLLGDRWKAFSAGTKPSGYVHPLAIQVMAEIDIDISANKSKSVDIFRNVNFDRIITVCDHAAQNCPTWIGPGMVTHIGFPDPADADGTEEEKLAVFRQVRDNIHEHIIRFLNSDVNPLEVHIHAP